MKILVLDVGGSHVKCPRHRTQAARRVRVRAENDSGRDGEERAADHQGLALRCGVDGLSRRGPSRRARAGAPQSGPGLGGLRFPGGVRAPGQDHQRRGDAGARRLQGRKDALSRARHRARIGADRRRRDRGDGAGTSALLEAAQLRRLSRRARASAPGDAQMARPGERRRWKRFYRGAAARIHLLGGGNVSQPEAAAAAHLSQATIPTRFSAGFACGSRPRSGKGRMGARAEAVFLLDCRQHAARQRPRQRRPARASRARVRRAQRAIATGRSSRRCAPSSATPTTSARCSATALERPCDDPRLLPMSAFLVDYPFADGSIRARSRCSRSCAASGRR